MNRKNWIIAWFLIAMSPILMAAKCDPGAQIACPSPKTYSKSFLEAVSKEIDIIAPQAPHVMTMIADYDVTLRAIRVCLKYSSK